MGAAQSNLKEISLDFKVLDAYQKRTFDTCIIQNCPTSEDAAKLLFNPALTASLVNNVKTSHIAIRFKIKAELSRKRAGQPRSFEFKESCRPLIVSFESAETGEKVIYWLNGGESELRSCSIGAGVSEEITRGAFEFIIGGLSEGRKGENGYPL
jgi:hypothetical protein